MNDPRTMPLLRAEFTLADGTVLERDWTMDDVQRDGEPLVLIAPPSWLTNLRKRWDHPQDPITHRADVVPGREAEARVALGVFDADEDAAGRVGGHAFACSVHKGGECDRFGGCLQDGR